jgi:ligand-binding sensor domain-containing protein
VRKRALLTLAALALLAAACGDEAATTTAGPTTTTTAPATTTSDAPTTTTAPTTTLPPEPQVGWMAWAATNLGFNEVPPPPCGGCSGGTNPVERSRPIVYVDAQGVVWTFESDNLTRWDPSTGEYSPVVGLLDPTVFAMDRAPDGTLWLATYDGANTYDGDSFGIGLTSDLGLKGETTWEVWAQSNGTVWVTTNQGYILSAWDGTDLRHFSDPETAAIWGPGIEAVFPEQTQFSSMAEGPDGTVWFGTYGKGLFSFNGTAWARYTEAEGLPSGSVEDIAFTPDGTLWLDVIGGLAHFDGTTFELVDPEAMGDWQGEYPDGLGVGPDGALWVLSNQGAFRYLDGLWEYWEEADGLAFGDTTSLTIGEDGTVWVADAYGVARYGEFLPATGE